MSALYILSIRKCEKSGEIAVKLDVEIFECRKTLFFIKKKGNSFEFVPIVAGG